MTTCNKDHRYWDGFKSLPYDQGGFERHKCAYEVGYKAGLKREEGDCIVDSRVMDGFNVRVSGNKLVLSYHSEITMKDFHDNNFEDDVCPAESGFASDTLGFKEQLNDMKLFIDDYAQAITQTMYDADNSKYFSFTSDKNGFWNRKLDYIFKFQNDFGTKYQYVSS